MAAKPQVIDMARRLQRQQSYQSAPTLAAQWPGIDEIALELRFSGASGQSQPMPYRQIFLPQMQVFFDFLCPDRDCLGGGFDLSKEVRRLVTDRSPQHHWKQSCRGQQRAAAGGMQPCAVQLGVSVNIGIAPAA